MHEHELDEGLSSQRVRASKWMLAACAALGAILLLIGIDVVAVAATRGPKAPRPIIRPVRTVTHVVKVGFGVVAPVVYLSVGPGVKPAADGNLHDAYSVTDFVVHPDQPVTLVINDTDNVDHGIVSPEAGVNLTIRPGVHQYTLLVRRRGVFMWHCNRPCDPWSMAHMGYMMGEIVSA